MSWLREIGRALFIVVAAFAIATALYFGGFLNE
jgi:hypothetical protein